MGNDKINPYKMAQAQFDKAGVLLSLEPNVREFLRQPMREYQFVIPILAVDGTVKIFNGFRVQHNNALGPCKGGIRFHPLETIDQIRALSMLMTWKCAIVDIPLGGAMGGVVCDPHSLSIKMQELLCRGWVRQMANNIGPLIDIPEPDIMTNSQHMLWMLDEYEALHGGRYPGAMTGKSVTIGGALGRSEATGYGLVYMLREALKKLNLKLKDTTASIQGFGNVAQHVIKLYEQLGGKVKCVSCWCHHDQVAYSFKKEDGLELKTLLFITDDFGEIDKDKARQIGCEVLPGDAWLEQEVDILIPAALEYQVTSDNVNKIRGCVKIIAEGANTPITSEAEAVIDRMGIQIIPDFIANSGGVICGYFEQVQSNMNYYWSEDEVFGKLDVKMTSAFIKVSELAEKKGINLRDAAHLIGVARVAQACHERGWI